MAITSGYSAEDLARLGPDALTRKKMLAEALLAESMGQKKIEHPLEGAAQMANALVSGLRVRKLDQAEQAGKKSGDSAWASLFSASSPPSSASVPTAGAMGSSMPEVSPSGEIPVTDISGDKQTFINSLLPAAMEEAKRTGVDPRIIVAQAAQETGWGKSAPGNNFFGIKSHGQDGGQTLATNEVIDGKTVRVNDSFRQFASPEESVKGYGDFILQNPRYRGLREARGLDAQLEALGASGYATDPNYANSVGSIARGIKLPNEVSSLDPSIGMPEAMGQMQKSSPAVAPEQAAQAPALPPPVNVSTPPVPPQSPQQLAQALTRQQGAPAAPSGPSVQDLAKILSNPWVSDERKSVAKMLLGQQLEQNDPLHKMQLEKGQFELEQLRNPRLSPAEKERIDLEKQKLDFEQNGISATDKAKTDLDRERLALDREKFDREAQKGQWQKLTDGRLYNETTGEFRDAPPPVPGSTPPKFDDISGIRKEIQQLPSYKNLAQAAPIYKSMAETAGRNSKASDLNLVYGLGKIMDPNSVVREGEMVMVKNTASLPDWLQGAIASLNGGAALTPETRQAIMTEAFGRVNNYNDEFQRNIEQYKGIAQRSNMNQDDIIPPIDKFEPWKASPAQGGNPLPPTPAGGMNKTTTGIPWKVLQ